MTMTNPEDSTAISGPYARAAGAYWQSGWRGLLPLPHGKKTPVPHGYTGAEGADPSYPDIQAWSDGPEGAGNIALRLPPNIIGIDVDAYGGKPARLVLDELEKQLGALPPTWRSTSRDDGTSGIRLYRVPTGLRWPGGLGPGIDLLRRGHRYALAWPSVHPEGGTYRWITPNGATTLDQVPDADQLPDLPEAWVAKFTGDELETEQARADLNDKQIRDWLGHHAEGTPCRRTQRATDDAISGMGAATSRHDHTLQATNRIIWLASEGHTGLAVSLHHLRTAFLSAVSGDRDPTDAEHEWARMITGAVRLAAARDTDPSVDPCTDPFAGLIPKERSCPPPANASPPPSNSSSSSSNASPPTGPIASAPTASKPAPDDPTSTPADSSPATDPTIGDASREVSTRFRNGAEFILDIPESIPAIWGHGESVLWAAGEALTICGPAGVGKTTLTGQVVRARIVGGDVLDLPVAPTETRVLYLAMDRPRQIARALRRTLGDLDRDILEQRLIVWPGPPVADVAAHPETLLGLVQLAGADTVIVDSIKDAAVGLSNDEVGAGYNRARQMCIAAGIEVIEQHHMVKKGENGAAPNTLADLYGSVWIGAGAGSVINLHGVAGDPIVSMRHLKTPAEEVGPYRLMHDHEAGETTIYHQSDLVALARLAGRNGITAKEAARATDEKENPSRSDVEKARRRLDKLARDGRLERVEGRPDGTGGTPKAAWLHVPDVLSNPVDNPRASSHESSHARDWTVTSHERHEQSRPPENSPENRESSSHESSHGSHGRSSHDPAPPSQGGGSAAETPLGRWVPIAGGTQEVNTHTKEVRVR